MNDPFTQRLATALEALGAARRSLPIVPQGMINLSSNDYLGILEDVQLREAFYAQLTGSDRELSAASSRLLTGNVPAVQSLEAELAQAYGREAALVFGSGYHANTGILGALAGKNTLVLADKLIHASMIDGIKLSGCKFYRFKHNDLADARRLLEAHANEADEVFLMTESVFSMDGDRVDLKALVQLKKEFPNVLLYLDEAHGVGVFGDKGLGCAEAEGVIDQIDFLIGTLGKAFSSTGAYVITSQVVKETLVNKMRPFIFTTALPPINLAWTSFVLRALPTMGEKRAHLHSMGKRLADVIRAKGIECVSDSQIVPYILGENEVAIAKAKQLQSAGFYVLPIRPPTVPQGTSRLRFSLNAALAESDFVRLLETLQ